MKHERYEISIAFTVCEGLKDRVLAEIRDLLQSIKLGHASEVKTKVIHKEIGE